MCNFCKACVRINGVGIIIMSNRMVGIGGRSWLKRKESRRRGIGVRVIIRNGKMKGFLVD